MPRVHRLEEGDERVVIVEKRRIVRLVQHDGERVIVEIEVAERFDGIGAKPGGHIHQTRRDQARGDHDEQCGDGGYRRCRLRA